MAADTPIVPPVLPRADAQFAASIGGRLVPAKEWFDYFRALRAFVDGNSDLQAEIDAIIARLDTLEGATIVGLNSVQTFGSLSDGLVTVMLRGDVAAPGALQYYGTGPDETRGFWPAASLVEYLTDESGNFLVDEGGNYLIGADITADLFAIVNTDTPGILLHNAFQDWRTLEAGPGIAFNTTEPGATIEFDADTGLVAALPGATYDTVQKLIDVMFSPGIITGGVVTALDPTTTRIGGGTAILRVLDDNVSELRLCDFAGADFNVPDVQTTHFYALDYNAGSPTIVQSLVDTWDRDTQIPLGSAFRLDGALNVTANPYRVGDVITNLLQRADATGPVLRDNSVGGLLITNSGANVANLSAGRLWARVSDFVVPAKVSTTDPLFKAFFNGVNLTVTGGNTTWDNLNYNTGGALVALGLNKFANLWFFCSFDGTKWGYAYGTGEYNTAAGAQAETVPAFLTQNFFNQTILLGRFIFQRGATAPTIIETAFGNQFTSGVINNHNLLDNLQGGSTSERYHATAAQNATLTTLDTGGTTGQFFRGDKTWSNALTNGLIVNVTGFAVVGTDVGVGTLTPALSGSGRQFTVSSAVAAGDFVRINLQGNITAANGAIGTLDVYNAAAGLAVAQWQTFRDGANDAAGQIWTTRAAGGGLTQRLVLMSNGNMGFFTPLASVSFGSGVGVAYIRNATTLPTTNPVGGGILYADAGAGKWRGSSGTVTTFGPADPHCPKCGSDFVHEWDNPEKYGYLAVCMYCFADGVHSVTRTRGEWSTHKG